MGIIKTLEEKPYFKWIVLGNIATGTFMSTLDSSIVNVALPTIAQEFVVTKGVLQWVVTSYLLTISSLLLAFGRLADIVGKNKVYAAGFLGFVIGSALCGSANSVWQLVIYRIIQAFGAAMLMSNGMGILTSVFPAKERGRALGLAGTMVALGSLTGPSLGGVLVSSFGWPSIFYINIPIGILGFIASVLLLPKDLDVQKNQSFDFVGALLFSVGMALLLLGFSNVEEYGFGSSQVINKIVIGALILAAFFMHQLRTVQPMIDLTLFRNPLFFAGNIAGLLSFVAMFFSVFLMPFYLQDVLGLKPSQVGLMMTPFPVAMALVAPVSGWLSDKIGFVYLTTGGLLVTAAGMASFLTLAVDSSLPSVVVRFLLLGIGAGLFQSPNNSSIMGTVPRPKLGIAGGVIATVRNVGMVFGIAISVALFNTRYNAVVKYVNSNEAFVRSLHFVFAFAMGISLLAAFISLVRGKVSRGKMNYSANKAKEEEGN